MSKKLTSEEIISEYQNLRDSLNRLESELKNQIITLVNGISVNLGFPIYGRIKEVSSLIQKQNSGSFKIKRTIKELQDLVGFRIILLFKKDVEKLVSLLYENLNVIKQYDTQSRLSSNQFGYSSVHLVVRIPISWSDVPIFQGLEDINVEIQLRTLAQHTWAESVHLLNYKDDFEIPEHMIRDMSRISALLETVDSEFFKLLKDKELYIKQLSSNKINATNLEKILDTMLPPEFKTGSEKYDKAAEVLNEKGFSEKSKVESLISNHINSAIEFDTGIVQAIIDDNGKNDSVNYKGREYSTQDSHNVIKRNAFGNQIFLLSFMINQELTEKSI